MPQAKSKKSVGLGNTLMNDRFGKGKGADRKRSTAVTRVNHTTGEHYVVNDKEEASWVKMKSVTEQGALDEFLATAELAGTDFTAEKMNNVKIIHSDQKNPYLLTPAEERHLLGKQEQHRARLSVPRRPHWDSSTTPEELDLLEKDVFLSWRKSLAELQENHDLLMTPFERNLEVWRQLWRVIERSDVVVQIVDARNPLLFRSEDLEAYVKDVDAKKENLLLINKADMMTYRQRKAWAAYLKGAKIAFKFFSASLAKEENEAREIGYTFDERDGQEGSSEDPERSDDGEKGEMAEAEAEAEGEENEESGPAAFSAAPCCSAGDESDSDSKILTVEELEEMFLQYAPKGTGDRKLQVGLVGYPNVGKSSTINALVGAKKVSVSSTPGKTKHFQTIHLSERVMLCDCPGLVFPNFASTKADLVCNGVLPIDQLREYTGPAALVTERIPRSFLEAVYGIQIKTRPLEEGGSGVPTGSELLAAYARHRGFMTQGQGQPDQSRAARYVLKDYVNGKLLYCEPPPGDIDPREFNHELYDVGRLPTKRRHTLASSMEAMTVDGDDSSSLLSEAVMLPSGTKSQRLDKAFFKAEGSSDGHLKMPFNHKYTEHGAQMASQKLLSGRKLRAMIALETGVDVKDVQLKSSKKHFKGGRRGKGHGKAKEGSDD